MTKSQQNDSVGDSKLPTLTGRKMPGVAGASKRNFWSFKHR